MLTIPTFPLWSFLICEQICKVFVFTYDFWKFRAMGLGNTIVSSQ